MEKKDSYLYDYEKSEKNEQSNKQDFQSITKHNHNTAESKSSCIKASYLVY